jgi:hypothetical protein
MFGARWVVGIGALLVAIVALCVLFGWGNAGEPRSAMELTHPALDEIDEESRRALRDLLRQDASGE